MVPLILGQTEIDLTYELTCEVTSNTTLWNPGTHDFEMSCEGYLHAPLNQAFTLNGSGTATYSCVGGGFPPCEFDLNINFSGYLSNSFFTGPLNLSASCHGETVLVPTTPSFIRTEEIRDLSVNGTFNGFSWNLTTPTATVDFTFIDAEGKAFQFQVTGTSHLSLGPEIAPPSIHQGDLILTGNNVTTIEGRFDINGSIIVEDNATLHLKNAFLNFTPTEWYQYNITLENPSNGNPSLLAYNSTITSNFGTIVYLEDNSTGTIDNSTISNFCTLYVRGSSYLSISSSSHVSELDAYDSSVVSTYNSTISSMYVRGSSEVRVYNSEINWPFIYATSVNCTISKLEPGLISYWSFITNCSVNILSGGSTPNVTFTNTNVGHWGFGFFGYSNVAITNSIISSVSSQYYSVVSLKSTTCSNVNAYSYSVLLINDSTITNIWARHFSNSWLLNSTYYSLDFRDSAKVHVSWYLDVHVIDSIDQDVPFANVTATYPNTTIAESKLTDANGWARLPLTEKMMNATGEYPVGNYTVEATYLTYSNNATVNMTENKQIILTLEDFVIPEFPSFLILLLFMIATLLAVIVHRRKHTR